MNEKERYAKYLELGTINNTVPLNLNEPVDLNQIRRVPLGKVVTQMEMTNPDARRHLKQMLETQIRERELEMSSIAPSLYRRNQH